MICSPNQFRTPAGSYDANDPFDSHPSTRAEDEAALVLWLRWNDAFEKVNHELYAHRQDPEVLDVLMSQLDSWRQEAVRRTEAALSTGCEA